MYTSIYKKWRKVDFPIDTSLREISQQTTKAEVRRDNAEDDNEGIYNDVQ